MFRQSWRFTAREQAVAITSLGGGLRLPTTTQKYPNVRAKDHLEVFGLVVGSFRKY